MLITGLLRSVNTVILKFMLINCYKGLDVVHLKLLIRPIEIEDLFLRLGARTQALDPSKEILPVPFQCMAKFPLPRKPGSR